MKPFVERHEGCVTAGSVGRYVRAGVPAAGTLPSVGGTWEYRDGVFTVAHPRPVPALAALLRPDDPPAVERYPVRLLAPAADPAKPRRWWACPGCGRKCSDLFLRPPLPRLACRRCHRLRYTTQYESRSARASRKAFERTLDELRERVWDECFGRSAG